MSPAQDKGNYDNGKDAAAEAFQQQAQAADEEITEADKRALEAQVDAARALLNNSNPFNPTPGSTPPKVTEDEFKQITSALSRFSPGRTAGLPSLSRSSDGRITYAPGGGVQSVDVTANMRHALDYFTQVATRPDGQHWTKDQAAGIVANLYAESRFNPTAVGDGGQAGGIAQWHADRRAVYARLFGEDMMAHPDLDKQLAFVNYELNHSEIKAGLALQEATEAGEAGAIVSKKFERPANAEGEAASRAAKARGVVAQAGAESRPRASLRTASQAPPSTGTPAPGTTPTAVPPVKPDSPPIFHS